MTPTNPDPQVKRPRCSTFGQWQDDAAEKEIEELIEIIQAIRKIRADYHVAPSRSIEAFVITDTPERAEALKGHARYIQAFAGVCPLHIYSDAVRVRGKAS